VVRTIAGYYLSPSLIFLLLPLGQTGKWELQSLHPHFLFVFLGNRAAPVDAAGI
jgi:hypothetical protein